MLSIYVKVKAQVSLFLFLFLFPFPAVGPNSETWTKVQGIDLG